MNRELATVGLLLIAAGVTGLCWWGLSRIGEQHMAWWRVPLFVVRRRRMRKALREVDRLYASASRAERRRADRAMGRRRAEYRKGRRPARRQ